MVPVARRSTSAFIWTRIGGWSLVWALSTVFLLSACASPTLVAESLPNPEPTDPGPTDPVPTDPEPSDPPPIDPVPVELHGVVATIELGSVVALAWSVVAADAIEVACVAPDETRALLALPGDASGALVPIPTGDCLTLQVTATGHPSAVTAEAQLDHVVRQGGDAGEGSLRDVLASAPQGAVIGFAADVLEVLLTTVEASGAQDAHLIFARDVVVSGRPDAPVVVRSDASVPADPSGAPVSRSRVGYVPAGASVHLDGLVLTGGGYVAHGGGLRNDGDLTLTRSIVEGNRAWYWGGGVVNFGTALVEDSVLRGNAALVTDAERAAPYLCTGDPTRSCAPGDPNYVSALGPGGAGGGFYNRAGTAALVRTRIAENRAVFSGGGVYVFDGFVEVIDGAIDDNLASDEGTTIDSTSYGGGIAISGTGSAALRGGSVTANVSADMGGGVGNGTSNAPDRPTELEGVVVTGNQAGGYGGGVINYHTGDAGNLVETGGAVVDGNTAAVAGDERFDSLVDGP